MTDKVQKIREEVEKRYEYWKEKESNSHSIESEIRMSECQHLLLMLNSLQKEPVDYDKLNTMLDDALSKETKESWNERLDKKEPVSENLEEASREWLVPQLDKSYANYGEGKMMELTHFDGYAMLDAIEFGAKLQKEKMMKDAVEGKVLRASLKNDEFRIISDKIQSDNLKVCEEVKIIVIKED